MTTPKRDPEFLPRVDVFQDDYGKLFIETREEYSRDIFDYVRQFGRFEYLSLTESESIAQRRVEEARAEALRDAIVAINKVQNAIATYQSNSSEILSGIKEAWNINARFLSENFEAQSKYLESARASQAGDKGKEGEDEQ